MQGRSRNEAESKANPSGPQAPQPTPTFKASLVLDAFSGVFCDRRGWAHLLLRTVDGQEFECFIDGIVAKGFSDRLLGLAGNLILQSHGESVDLRPLHELDDDDADAERPIPQGLPAIAPQPLPDGTPPNGDGDPGTLAEPPVESAFPHIDTTLATRSFVKSFGGKPDKHFANETVRAIARTCLEYVDQDDPEVKKIIAQLSAYPS
jgi:hypothetical protein